MILQRFIICSLVLALIVGAPTSRTLCQSDPYGTVNTGPEFEPMSTRLVNEGETYVFGVTARDPEGSPVRLYAGKLPPSAKFKDNGDGTGTFSWTVP